MQIDRIMEAFAMHYCKQNPDLFDDTDTCYILSFSIIMLNTTLHNVSVNKKNRLSMNQFVEMNRGINAGQDLPKDMLESIYKSIKKEPFEVPDDSNENMMHLFSNPECEGWLLKQGRKGEMKKRYFVLEGKCLYYFKSMDQKHPTGIIPLVNASVRIVEDIRGNDFLFEVYSDTKIQARKITPKGELVQDEHKSYRMATSSEEERATWMQGIEENTQMVHVISDQCLLNDERIKKKWIEESGQKTHKGNDKCSQDALFQELQSKLDKHRKQHSSK